MLRQSPALPSVSFRSRSLSAFAAHVRAASAPTVLALFSAAPGPVIFLWTLCHLLSVTTFPKRCYFYLLFFFASWLMKMTYDYALDILLFDFKRLGVSASLCLSCNSSATSVLLLPHVGSSDNFLINFVFILKKASCSNRARITLSR